MARKWLIVGVILIVAGLVGRYVPHVVTGVSIWSIAELAGIVIVFRWLFPHRDRIRSWIREAPIGKQMGLLGVFAIFVLFLDLGAGIVREVKTGRKYALVAADLEKEDPLAAMSLARHYSGEESAPLRERIVIRMGELGNSSPRVTGTLREAVMIDDSAAVRAAAADSLVKLMTPLDVMNTILRLPDLKPESRAMFVDILSRHIGKSIGKSIGDDTARWLSWVTSNWAGERGDAAYQLALTAFKRGAEQPVVRDACLLRLEDPDGVSEQTLAATLRHESARVRGAAARAMGRTHANRWRAVLVNAVKIESDSTAAMRMATALLDLDPDEAGMALIEVARTARHDAGRNAALSALSGAYATGGGAELPDIVYAVRQTMPTGPDRREALDLLVRMAKESGAAVGHLKSILGDKEENSRDRGRALDGILGAIEEEFTSRALVELLVDPPGTDFAQKVRGELKRRTGKDGGRDAEAWRKIIKNLDGPSPGD